MFSMDNTPVFLLHIIQIIPGGNTEHNGVAEFTVSVSAKVSFILSPAISDLNGMPGIFKRSNI